MATLSNAVQALVDSLHSKMTSQYPLSPEEQLLASKAIDALTEHTSLEQALVAVAEQHMDEAKAAMVQSTDEATQALAASTVNAQTAYDNVSVKSQQLDKIPELQTQISELPKTMQVPWSRTGEPYFVLDYYDNTQAEIGRTNNNSYDSYGPYNAISMLDYLSGDFYVYWDCGAQTNGERLSSLVRIDKNGDVSKATSGTKMSTNDADKLGLIKLDDMTHRLCHYQNSSSTFSFYQHMSFEKEASIVLDYLNMYQDLESLVLYAVSQGKVSKLGAEGWVSMEHLDMADSAAFDVWANEQGLTSISALMIGGTISTNTSIKTARGYTTTGNTLAVYRPNNYAEYMRDAEGISSVKQTGSQNLSRYLNSQIHGGDTVFTRSYRGRIKLPQKNGNYVAMLESVISNNNSTSGENHNHYTPMIIASSPIHRALVVSQYWGVYAGITDRVYFA